MRRLLFLFISTLSFQASAGEVGFLELIVRDQRQAQDFYSQALGWKFQDVGAKDFFLITNAGIKGALLSTAEDIKRGSSVKIFFKSQQLAADLARIKKAGGSIEIEPRDVGDSWIAEFRDPAGNWLGLICDKTNACVAKTR